MTRNPHPTVLVVEDNPDLRDTISELLESESFASWTAESAADALRQLETRRDRPDVILLDVVMPGMPAVDFIARFRENPAWSDTRIVFMTGLSSAHLPRSVEVDAIVKKPFTPDQLFSTIRSVL